MLKVFRKNKVLKLRKPHGVKGYMLADFYIDDPSSLIGKTLLAKDIDMTFVIDDIFGVSGDVVRVKIKGFDSPEAFSNIRNVDLYVVEYDNSFFLEDLIGAKIIYHSKFVGYITDIHDFGAGLVFDTDFDRMLSVSEVDINSFKDGSVNLIDLD